MMDVKHGHRNQKGHQAAVLDGFRWQTTFYWFLALVVFLLMAVYGGVEDFPSGVEKRLEVRLFHLPGCCWKSGTLLLIK